mgnify:CR=1 FL=1
MKLPAGFDAEVWAATEQIPAGRVATYGQIARLVGMPGYARHVGRALARAPQGVPCHRVVGSGGSLTGYAGGVEKKMRLLTLENSEAAKFYR